MLSTVKRIEILTETCCAFPVPACVPVRRRTPTQRLRAPIVGGLPSWPPPRRRGPDRAPAAPGSAVDPQAKPL